MGFGLQPSLRFVLRFQCPYRHLSTWSKKPDYYKILGVHSESTTTEIKAAYMRLCQVYHPDKGGCKDKFSELQQAYEVLSKIQSRYAYDAGRYSTYGKSRPSSSPSGPDMFYHQPGGGSNFRRSSGPRSNYEYAKGAPPYGNWQEGRNYGPGNYYGIPGVGRMTNVYIVLVSMAFCMIGTVIHYFTLKTHSARIRDKAFARSEATYKEYMNAKDNYNVYGRDGNLRRIFGEDVEALNDQEFENMHREYDTERRKQ